MNRVLQADENLSFNITKATFSANSTLDWHKHSESQVLVVVDGSLFLELLGRLAQALMWAQWKHFRQRNSRGCNL